MQAKEKTNVMRILDKNKVEYESFLYPADGELTGTDVAEIIGVETSRAFKTLVTEGKSGAHYVFDIPVNCELDLKKAAAAVGEKNVSMIKSKELLPLTGYIHGGFSPLGMKKFFKTTFDVSASSGEYVYFSGGKLGVFLRVKLCDLQKIIKIGFADLTV